MTIYYCWGCRSWITRDDIETRVTKEATFDCPAVTEDVHMNCGSGDCLEIQWNEKTIKEWLNDQGIKPSMNHIG